MALSIKSEVADALARELAVLSGESLTDVVVSALREQLIRSRAMRGPGVVGRIRQLQDELSTLPVLDPAPVRGVDSPAVPDPAVPDPAVPAGHGPGSGG